jgi:hypothetical protein
MLDWEILMFLLAMKYGAIAIYSLYKLNLIHNIRKTEIIDTKLFTKIAML